MKYAERKLIEMANSPTEILTESEMKTKIEKEFGINKDYHSDYFVDYATRTGYTWNEEKSHWYK